MCQVHAFNPKCKIHTWDGTLPDAVVAPPFVELHRVNFDEHSWRYYSSGAHGAAKHGAPKGPANIAILKIDCEGCEFGVLPSWLRNTCTDQILLEMHVSGQHTTEEVARDSFFRPEADGAALMRQMLTTHDLFFAEPTTGSGCCAEYALRRKPAAKCAAHS